MQTLQQYKAGSTHEAEGDAGGCVALPEPAVAPSLGSGPGKAEGGAVAAAPRLPIALHIQLTIRDMCTAAQATG